MLIALKTFWKEIPGQIRRFIQSPDFYVLLVCIVIAAGLWLLNALSKPYRNDILINIQYTNPPKDKMPVKELIPGLILRVEASGFNLLRERYRTRKHTLTLNLAKYERTPYLPSASLMREISAILPNAYQLVLVKPDTIYLLFDKLTTKKVPVKFVEEITCERQFGILGTIELDPDSILVTGPRELLDTLTRWRTNPVISLNADKTLTGMVELAPPPVFSIRLSSEKVWFNVPIVEFTEKTLTVPITEINLPEKMEAILLPAQVKVRFWAPVTGFDNIREQDFEVVADFSNRQNGQSALVSLHVSRQPKEVNNVILEPDYAEFILYR